MPFTKKEWQDTRPSDCKASGVGEACADWAKNCPSDVDKIAGDKTKTSAALATINEMLTALKTAEGKLSKSKDEKKVSATKTLITTWRKAAASYQNELNKAVFTFFGEELKDKAKQVEKNVNQILMDNKITIEMNIAKLLDEAEDAIKKKDVDGSEGKLTSAKRKIFDMTSFLKKKLPETIKVESDRVGLPVGTVKVGAFASGINEVRTALKKAATRADDLDDQWDALVDGASPTEPDTSKDDPTTKKNTETVLKLYKETLKDMAGCQTKAQTLLKKYQGLKDNSLIGANPTGIVTVVAKALAQIQAVEKEAKEVMFDIRESSGKCVTKRRELFKPDNAKPFIPFLTRAITINGRLITALSNTEDELKEALEAIISGGDQKAVGPASELLKKF